MLGGQFQGSVNGVTYTTFYTVTRLPIARLWTTVPLAVDLSNYRYLRYLGPPRSFGNVAEIEFDRGYGPTATKIIGTPFGTPGSLASRGTTFAMALDGNRYTFFAAPSPGTNDFVGIDRGPSQTTVAPVKLPIEVMGADGTTASVQVSMPPTASATGLWMQVHNLSYADKASVQINGGSWTALDNTTVQVAEPGKNYGGIGGEFSTLKMLMPIPPGVVTPGTNTITFRFNQTDGVSIGFRVLAFNLMTASGQPILPSTAFVQDDPSTWQSPMTDAADIQAGSQLWHSGTLRSSNAINAQNILATCSDCHTQDGRDLKYFNYSNYSIIQRSQFHGLSATQGMQIASYIRTLTNADGSAIPTPGRPWNPPYQPGPGLDSQPVSSWAAGAGVNAALDSDSQTLPYLFPNGVTKDAVSTEGDLNVREIPVALQLLDWNHWLPVIHPKDAYGNAFLQDRTFTDYQAIRTNLTGPNAQSYIEAHVGNDQPSAYMTQARLDLNHWFGDYTTFAFPKTQTTLTPLASEAIYSSSLWQRVKVWEIMQEFSMEDLGKIAFGPRAEERTWLDPGTFNISPGKAHLPDDIADGGFTQNTLQFETLNNQWYYLGLIQNAGNGYRAGTNPIDWGYARPRILNLMEAGGPPLPLMELIWTTKGSQQGAGLGLDDIFGWSPTSTGDLMELFYEDPWFTRLVGQHSTDAAWSPGTEKPVVQAALQTWFDKVQTYTPQQYYAAGFADPAYVPVVRDNGLLGDRVMAYLTYARGVGIDDALIDRIAQWGKTVWPLGDWEALELATGNVVASIPNPGPSGTGAYPNLVPAPSASYAIEFDVTEDSYIDKDFATVTIPDPSGNGRGYQFGLGTFYNANDLHVFLDKVNDAGTTSGLQNAAQFDAAATVGKTVHVRVDMNGQNFLLRASNPLPAPQEPFTGSYPYQAQWTDSTYSVAGAQIGVTYLAPSGISPNMGLHISNLTVIQSQP